MAKEDVMGKKIEEKGKKDKYRVDAMGGLYKKVAPMEAMISKMERNAKLKGEEWKADDLKKRMFTTEDIKFKTPMLALEKKKFDAEKKTRRFGELAVLEKVKGKRYREATFAEKQAQKKELSKLKKIVSDYESMVLVRTTYDLELMDDYQKEIEEFDEFEKTIGKIEKRLKKVDLYDRTEQDEILEELKVNISSRKEELDKKLKEQKEKEKIALLEKKEELTRRILSKNDQNRAINFIDKRTRELTKKIDQKSTDNRKLIEMAKNIEEVKEFLLVTQKEHEGYTEESSAGIMGNIDAKLSQIKEIEEEMKTQAKSNVDIGNKNITNAIGDVSGSKYNEIIIAKNKRDKRLIEIENTDTNEMSTFEKDLLDYEEQKLKKLTASFDEAIEESHDNKLEEIKNEHSKKLSRAKNRSVISSAENKNIGEIIKLNKEIDQDREDKKPMIEIKNKVKELSERRKLSELSTDRTVELFEEQVTDNFDNMVKIAAEVHAKMVKIDENLGKVQNPAHRVSLKSEQRKYQDLYENTIQPKYGKLKAEQPEKSPDELKQEKIDLESGALHMMSNIKTWSQHKDKDMKKKAKKEQKKLDVILFKINELEKDIGE
jgi:hypothetical protein